ncbi:MAG: cytochrome c family protein, partial [Mesorhizobium sp.]
MDSNEVNKLLAGLLGTVFVVFSVGIVSDALFASPAPEKQCQACHSGEKGGPNKVGPDLWDIIDRPVAEHEGFAYSAGMKDFSKGGAEKWTYDNLNHFITSPKKFVKGTAMGFAGLPKDEDRANVIAYLRTLSDSPKPLPAPGASA